MYNIFRHPVLWHSTFACFRLSSNPLPCTLFAKHKSASPYWLTIGSCSFACWQISHALNASNVVQHTNTQTEAWYAPRRVVVAIASSDWHTCTAHARYKHQTHAWSLYERENAIGEQHSRTASNRISIVKLCIRATDALCVCCVYIALYENETKRNQHEICLYVGWAQKRKRGLLIFQSTQSFLIQPLTVTRAKKYCCSAVTSSISFHFSQFKC